SRRKAEEIILGGRIKVNGSVVKELSFNIDEEKDIVEFDNKKVKPLDEALIKETAKKTGKVVTAEEHS
ncbi:S4 domain protein, partial [Clostridioides difficile Y184]